MEELESMEFSIRNFTMDNETPLRTCSRPASKCRCPQLQLSIWTICILACPQWLDCLGFADFYYEAACRSALHGDVKVKDMFLDSAASEAVDAKSKGLRA